MKQGSRFILGSACIVGGVTALVGVMAPNLLDPLVKSTEITLQHKLKVAITEDQFTSSEDQLSSESSGPPNFESDPRRVGFVDVIYPFAMRENETRPIEVTYTVMQLRPLEELDKLDIALKLELTSAGFTIEPNSEVYMQEKTPLPAKRVWTVTPSAEGQRSLLLRVEEEEANRSAEYQALINGETTQPDTWGFYVLPVSVTTFWGVSRLWAEVIGLAVTFIGGFLCHPIAISILRKLGPKGRTVVGEVRLRRKHFRRDR